LSPDTCFILNGENNSVGYIIAHPFKIGLIPPLNRLLGHLRQESDTLYIHDLALLPQARNGGNGKKAVRLMIERAKQKKLATLALVAVNGSGPFWQTNGFFPASFSQQLKGKLLTYGGDACYMTCNLDCAS
ncbi:GNAT family N-acetyltransferase, partial [uncultured Bartonella sp.]|uniref:GNAT family N-acetyltransferase n=1 Tax=uncultured Bartonella sp. TaxID=104108 RepID=UPI00263759C7